MSNNIIITTIVTPWMAADNRVMMILPYYICITANNTIILEQQLALNRERIL